MAEVIPFSGVLYNIPKVSKSSGEELLAPPYDIITSSGREELYAKSPYNIVRIDFGMELPGDGESENKYTRARRSLEQWLAEGIMARSEGPRFYSYEVSYSYGDRELRLRGFLGLVGLEELGKGNIHPHECTHSKPKKDRLDLTKICEANVSPIFSLYNSPDRRASRALEKINLASPYIEAPDADGSIHRLWEISDAATIEMIRDEMKDKAIFIADGHHRYETALEYRREMTEKNGPADSPRPYDYVLMFLANMADEGLTILPTHRLCKQVPQDALERLSADFDITENGDISAIASEIRGKDIFGFYRGGSTWYRLAYRGKGVSDMHPALKDLDVTVLHELIFKKLLNIDNIAYEMSVDRCIEFVRDGRHEAAFFLNPTQVSDVEAVALSSLRMPPKSTYFYPKLLTGMVLNKW